MKIQIYSPDFYAAAKLAASMNLSLRQWKWDGEHPDYPMMTWAYVEPLFARLERQKPDTEVIAAVLRAHQPTRGMRVAMGETCACGYWTGVEVPGKTRPAGYQGLQWHQAQEIAKVLSNLQED